MRRVSGKMGRAIVNTSGGSCGGLLFVLILIVVIIFTIQSMAQMVNEGGGWFLLGGLAIAGLIIWLFRRSQIIKSKKQIEEVKEKGTLQALQKLDLQKSMETNCPKCGRYHTLGVNYCQFCGEKLRTENGETIAHHI